MFASVLIANYNGEKYVEECIESLINQTYQNFEIIFFDDCSKDNSLNLVKKFKNIKIIKNNIQTINGHFNQMNAYNEAFKLSKGEIIFTLDSDDMFHPNKIENIIKYFNSGLKVAFDLPIILKDNKKIFQKNKSKGLRLSTFPFITQQSCLAISRDLFPIIMNDVFFNKYEDVWFDFRIGLFCKYKFRSAKIIDEHLTYYRISHNNISSKFGYLSNNWWKRRSDYHDYEKYYCDLKNIKYQKSIDLYLTKLVNFFFNLNK